MSNELTDKQHQTRLCGLKVRRAELEVELAHLEVNAEKYRHISELARLQNIEKQWHVELSREKECLRKAQADEERGFDA